MESAIGNRIQSLDTLRQLAKTMRVFFDVECSTLYSFTGEFLFIIKNSLSLWKTFLPGMGDIQ